ncbi:hypothetical protein [Anabaena sp. UHCC 0451]|uniref:hypothetical protein n=1 Tax=Anabaena sp. UHCC 0451 TaxID=2055235 RepID=UPI002B1FEB3F|nr:hypothetical protein [Anabaena sp. UHCC 0451]MEA5575307.1 hypothetical protein [Anabaena sp. UHCC 0451]
MSVARTRSLTDGKKLVIVENCHLKQWGDTELATLQQLVLVPCQTQNSLQLAAAMREGKSHQVLQLLDDLLSRSQPLMVIVSTILTQFRTWLWVKSAMVSGVKKDGELAQLCNISNPHRIYYLRQEVANTSINALAKAVTMILDLEMSIKRGAEGRDLLVVILGVCRLFQVV